MVSWVSGELALQKEAMPHHVCIQYSSGCCMDANPLKMTEALQTLRSHRQAFANTWLVTSFKV